MFPKANANRGERSICARRNMETSAPAVTGAAPDFPMTRAAMARQIRRGGGRKRKTTTY